MLPILWRAEAQADLAAILEYISERNPQSALDLYDDIERVVSHYHTIRICTALGAYLARGNSSFTPIMLLYIASVQPRST